MKKRKFNLGDKVKVYARGLGTGSNHHYKGATGEVTKIFVDAFGEYLEVTLDGKRKDVVFVYAQQCRKPLDATGKPGAA